MDTCFHNVTQNEDSKIYNWDYILENGRKIQGRTLRNLRNKIRLSGYKGEITDETLAEQSKNRDAHKQSTKSDSSPSVLEVEKNFNSKQINNNNLITRLTYGKF